MHVNLDITETLLTVWSLLIIAYSLHAASDCDNSFIHHCLPWLLIGGKLLFYNIPNCITFANVIKKGETQIIMNIWSTIDLKEQPLFVFLQRHRSYTSLYTAPQPLVFCVTVSCDWFLSFTNTPGNHHMGLLYGLGKLLVSFFFLITLFYLNISIFLPRLKIYIVMLLLYILLCIVSNIYMIMLVIVSIIE